MSKPSILEFAMLSNAVYKDSEDNVAIKDNDGSVWKHEQTFDLNATRVRIYKKDKVYVAAVRGTKITSIENIRDDIFIGIGVKPAGCLESRDFIVSLYDKVSKEPGSTLYLTGHSLGALVAEYLAYYLSVKHHDDHANIEACTFESPGSQRLLRSEFAEMFDSRLAKTLITTVVVDRCREGSLRGEAVKPMYSMISCAKEQSGSVKSVCIMPSSITSHANTAQAVTHFFTGGSSVYEALPPRLIKLYEAHSIEGICAAIRSDNHDILEKENWPMISFEIFISHISGKIDFNEELARIGVGEISAQAELYSQINDSIEYQSNQQRQSRIDNISRSTNGNFLCISTLLSNVVDQCSELSRNNAPPYDCNNDPVEDTWFVGNTWWPALKMKRTLGTAVVFTGSAALVVTGVGAGLGAGLAATTVAGSVGAGAGLSYHEARKQLDKLLSLSGDKLKDYVSENQMFVRFICLYFSMLNLSYALAYELSGDKAIASSLGKKIFQTAFMRANNVDEKTCSRLAVDTIVNKFVRYADDNDFNNQMLELSSKLAPVDSTMSIILEASIGIKQYHMYTNSTHRPV